MQAANRLKSVFTKGAGASMGLWQLIPDTNVSRAMAHIPGVDWVLVDGEHGNIDDGMMHQAVPAVAAAGASPIVRIPDMQPWMVKRALDSGAHGIMVPLVKTAQEARDIVKSAKFPPQGDRGFGSPFPMERFQPAPTLTEYLQQANDCLLTILQIETKEALESIDEIAAVDGVDCLFIGPFDLGNNIGHPIINNQFKPELTQAINHILAATKKAGKKAGVLAANGEQAKMFADQGFDMISVTIDFVILQQAMAGQIAISKGQGKA